MAGPGRRRLGALCLAAIGTLPVGACTGSEGGPGSGAATSGRSTSGSNAPKSYGIVSVDGLTVTGPESHSSFSAIVAGTLRLDADGCWRLIVPPDTEVTVVWPPGTRWSDSTHTAVTVDSGVTLRSGQSIRAGGGVLEKVDRSSVSVAPEVACLSGNPISFAPIDDVTVT